MEKKSEPKDKPTTESERETITRREFVQDAALATSFAAVCGSAALAAEVSRPQGAGKSGRLTAYQERKLANGSEVEMTVEWASPGKPTKTVHSFQRRIDTPDSYLVISRKHDAGKLSGRVVLISGQKGPVNGKLRADTVEITILLPDGSVYRGSPQQVNVLVENPYSGLSPQETLNQFLEDKASGRLSELTQGH